jgi:SAM-dependent methyltransferase
VARKDEIRYDVYGRGWLRRAWASLRTRPYSKLVKRGKLDPLRVADIGAADGHFTSKLEKLCVGGSVTGFELDETLRETGKQHGLHMESFDAEKDELPRRNYDLIFSAHLVEHLHNPEHFFQLMHLSTTPGARLIIVTPNPDGWCARLRGDNWIGHRDPTHVSLRGADEWASTLRTQGWNPEYVASSWPTDFPRWLFPLGLLSRALFALTGFMRWKIGNSVAIIAVRSQSACGC